MPNTYDGWIKAWRKIMTNSLWLEKPFSKGQAWMDLLMFATRRTHRSTRNGAIVQYNAGYVYESVSFLADRWGWNRMKVYRFFRVLKDEGMIDFPGVTSKRTSNVTQCVTPLRIVNWDIYQGERTDDVTPKRTPKRTHPKKDIYPDKDNSKEKNVYIGDSLPGQIDSIKPDDLAGYPDFQDMPGIAEGTKRDIPPRVRHLFNGDYGAYWRYRERCSTK